MGRLDLEDGFELFQRFNPSVLDNVLCRYEPAPLDVVRIVGDEALQVRLARGGLVPAKGEKR